MKLITEQMAEAASMWLDSSSDDIAQARGAAIRAEYRVKKVMAKQFLKAEGSNDVRKAIATCSAEYEEACEDHAKADADWEKLKVQRNKFSLMVEAWRTQQSYERGLQRATR